MKSKLDGRFYSSSCQEQSSESSKQKILIVGAGLAGVTTAYYLAKLGLYNITVIDKQFPI